MDFDLVNQNLMKARLSDAQSQVKTSENTAQKEKELKDACAGFEAILLHSMIKSMRESLPGDSLFEDSHSLKMYKSMYDQYLSEQLSKSHYSTGVKEFLYEELKESL